MKREDPVSYPYGDALTNEFQWLGWDSEDEDQKKDGQAIHEAFKQWVGRLLHERKLPFSFDSILNERIAKKFSTI